MKAIFKFFLATVITCSWLIETTFASSNSLNASLVYAIKIEALQAEQLVQDRASRIVKQAEDLKQEANSSLDALQSSRSKIDSYTLRATVQFVVREGDKIVDKADYIFHYSRNRSKEVRGWSREVIEGSESNDEDTKRTNVTEKEENARESGDSEIRDVEKEEKEDNDDDDKNDEEEDDKNDEKEDENEADDVGDDDIQDILESDYESRSVSSVLCDERVIEEEAEEDLILGLVDEIVELTYNITAVFGFVTELVSASGNATKARYFDEVLEYKKSVGELSDVIRNATDALVKAEQRAQSIFLATQGDDK